MIGSSPNIPLNASVSDQIAMQFDFRQIYSSIMQDCMSEDKLRKFLALYKLALFKTNFRLFLMKMNTFFVLSKPITNNTININFKDSLSDYVNVQLFTIQEQKSSKIVQSVWKYLNIFAR
jgi:hypothetical protein